MNLQGVLAAMLLAGPAHGYALQAALESELGPTWRVRTSHLYLTIQRMIQADMVVVSRVAQTRRPDRQLLFLTDRGRAIGEDWIEHPGRDDDTVVRLAVCRLSAPDRWAEVSQRALAAHSAALHELRLMHGRTHGYAREALALEVRRAEADVRWLADLRARGPEILALPQAPMALTRETSETA